MFLYKDFILYIIFLVVRFIHVHSLETSQSTFADLNFVAEPCDVITTRDKSVIFDCFLGGSSVRKLQLEHSWFRNDLPLVLSSRRKLLTNGSLLLEGKLEEGIYHCLIKLEEIGSISSRKAELRLLHHDRWNPASSRESIEIKVYPGDTAMLPCRNFSGFHSRHGSSITWLKGDAEIDFPSANHIIHEMGGGVLEIRSTQFSDFGRYRCLPSNGDHISEWWTEVLLIQNTDASSYEGFGPSFVIRPADTVAMEGGVVVLLCAANGRDRNGKKAQVVWLKDGATIDYNLDGHISLVGEGSLRIDGLMEEDSGQFTCRASNLEDSIDVDVTITVQVSPKIRVRPRNWVGPPHTDCQLSCDIYANPRPVVGWIKNGIPVALDDYVEVVDGDNLRILGVEPSDSGIYQCIADNAIGNIQAAAFLFVNHDNRTHRPVNADLPVPSALVSSITFMRSVTISWRLPDSAVNFEDVVGYMVSWSEEEDEAASRRKRSMNVTSLEANLQFLKPSTKYRVEIMSYDSEGSISYPAIDHFITQEEVQVPEPPLNLKASVISSTTIHLVWEDSNLENAVTVLGFKVFYFDVADGSTETEVTVKSTSCLLELKKFTAYSFRVAAFNSDGQSSSTDEVIARTYSDVPSEAPQNVTLETLSSTSILVRWEPPSEDSRNGIITGYRIKFKATKNKTSPAGIVVTDGEQVFHSLTELNKGTEYSIRVQSQTRNGTGPPSPWLQTHTLTHDLDESVVPGSPSNLIARPLTNSILISWTPPLNQGVMVRGYVVSYGIGAPHATRQILDAKQRYHTIKDLRSSSNYVITLMAFNAAGEGPPAYESAITREEQAVHEPSVQITPPVGLKAIVLSSTTILLTWTDTGLGKNQRVNDNRYYTVKYFPKNPQSNAKVRPKFINSTDLNVHIEDLKPDTEYEFSVRIAKGRRHSVYSLSVFNRTKEASPATAPRDVTPISVDLKPTWVSLSWQPPRQSNGQINGYLVYYTTDSSLNDADWVLEPVLGDRLSVTLKDLSLETTYYFKVQARNNVGYGPMSPTVIFKTPRYDGLGGGEVLEEFARSRYSSGGRNKNVSPALPLQTPNVPANVLWITIGCLSGLALVILSIVGVVLCRRKIPDKDDVDRNGYIPANKDKSVDGSLVSGRSKELKPPDLWTHGRNLEMKITDLGSNGDPDEMTEMMSRHASSVDEDGNSDTERYRGVNPRTKLMPLDSHVIRERDVSVLHATAAYLISNGHLTSTMTRPNYPRTQYSAQQQVLSTPRVNVGLVSPSMTGEQQNNLDSYADKQDSISITPNISGCLPPSIASKSPPPPPLTVPPILSSCSPLASSKHYPSTNNVSQEVTSDTKSFTTEELCAEMANLEGLMKDLSAITQQEFPC